MSASRNELNSIKNSYLDSILAGDKNRAVRTIDRCIALQMPMSVIYLSILVPAQRKIGRYWSEGRINVAQEHLASQITLEMMDRIRAALPPARKLDRRVVVTSVAGDMHDLGARMVADLFLESGWQVDFLSGSTPASDLVEFVQHRQPDLVALSATLKDHLKALEETIFALKQCDPPPRILAGGRATQGQEESLFKLGVDAVMSDPIEAIRKAGRLVDSGASEYSLKAYLQRLGEEIQKRRTLRGWSQQQLAEVCGLDRTYISAVERGRQNLSLGALVKLAAAIDVPPDQLLRGKPASAPSMN